MTWIGPEKAKVGEVFVLGLEVDSPDALRAMSLQLAYTPGDVEVVGIDDGRYFGKDDQVGFSKSFDAGGGRISVGISAPEGIQGKGAGKLLTLKLRA